MKIIEALKKIKDLRRKADDLKEKIKLHCADLDCETAPYPDQRRQVAEWLQAHSDIIKEILHLKMSISRTNLATLVTIELGGKQVTKSIMEWIERRRELAKLEEDVHRMLTDRGLKDTYQNQLTPNAPITIIKKRLYFDPVERDRKIEMFRSEPSIIDATLEITNAITSLIES
jgi:uncharacterized protein Yka (UPF0111/DUF47 family)